MSQDDWNDGFLVGVIAGMAPSPTNYYGAGGNTILRVAFPGLIPVVNPPLIKNFPNFSGTVIDKIVTQTSMASWTVQ
ncbi:hypothetical protein JCM15765_39890 [Paradesulfitobacterium aromaticivorans]